MWWSWWPHQHQTNKTTRPPQSPHTIMPTLIHIHRFATFGRHCKTAKDNISKTRTQTQTSTPKIQKPIATNFTQMSTPYLYFFTNGLAVYGGEYMEVLGGARKQLARALHSPPCGACLDHLSCQCVKPWKQRASSKVRAARSSAWFSGPSHIHTTAPTTRLCENWLFFKYTWMS